MRARVLAAGAAALLLAACDPVTYGEVVIQSGHLLDTACLTRVEDQLRAQEGVQVQGSIAATRQVDIQRGSDRVHVALEGSTSTRLTLSFKWLGRSPAAQEHGFFELLDDLQAELVRSCAVKESDLTVSRSCSARLCENWLQQNSRGL